MKRIGKKLVAGVLATVSLCSAVAFTGCKKNQADTADKQSVSVPQKPSYDGTIVQAGGKYKFTNKLAFLGSDIMPTGETGEYTPVSATVTATVLPADANQAVDWRVSFVNPNSAWAQGKTATDYVTVTTETEGSTTATISCIAPFGEQVKLECISQDNPKVKAECTIDLMQALEGASLTFGTDLPINFGGQTDVVWEINPTGVGKGGTANVVLDTSDVYTIPAEYSWNIDLVAPHEYYGTSNETIRTKWGRFDSKTTNVQNYHSALGYNDNYFVFNNLGEGNAKKDRDITLRRIDDINTLVFDSAFFEVCEAGYHRIDSGPRIQYYSDLSVADRTCNEVVGNGSDYYSKAGFGDIKEGSLYTLQLNVEGPGGTTKTYQSLLYLTGYTNVSNVQSITLDSNEIIF